MSAMKNNAKLLIRAKKVKSVLVLVQKDSFVSLSTNLKKKNVCKQSSLLLHRVLCNYWKLIRQI